MHPWTSGAAEEKYLNLNTRPAYYHQRQLPANQNYVASPHKKDAQTHRLPGSVNPDLF